MYFEHIGFFSPARDPHQATKKCDKAFIWVRISITSTLGDKSPPDSGGWSWRHKHTIYSRKPGTERTRRPPASAFQLPSPSEEKWAAAAGQTQQNRSRSTWILLYKRQIKARTLLSRIVLRTSFNEKSSDHVSEEDSLIF